MLQRLRPAYTQENLIPSRRQLSGRLLEDVLKKTKARVLELIRAWSLSSDQITVCVDGWENVNYCHIFNVLASCNGRTVLLDSVSTGAESQTAEAQARTIEQVMVKNGGVQIFGGVASDNTSSSVNARDLLAEKNPGLVSLQDQSHAADMLLEDIGKLRWSKEIIESTTFVSNCVRAKVKLRALYTARKTEYNKGENVRKGRVASAKSWKALCVTRFAYAHTLLTHATDSRLAL
jgi:hypothetical protein